MRRRTGRFKKEDGYNKIGRDFREIITNYKRYTTKTEFKIFIGIPVFISVLVFSYLGLFENSNLKLLQIIVSLNTDALTVIAILAGFNTTSLSIIAASNNKVLKYLKRHKTDDNKTTILQQLVSFCAFAILIQLIVLASGLTLAIISNNFADVSVIMPAFTGVSAKVLLSIFGAIWFGSILFTIIISIRNATLLYRYVLFIADYTDDCD